LGFVDHHQVTQELLCLMHSRACPKSLGDLCVLCGKALLWLALLLSANPGPALAGEFRLADYAPHADGRSDDTPALARCFAAVAAAGGGTLHISPGDYFVAAETPVPLASQTTVFAYGARFHLPRTLPAKVRLILFAGQDLTDFTWQGGDFRGFCFDPAQQENSWEPQASTRIFSITTSSGGTTRDIHFRDVRADRIAGAVISVGGKSVAKSESDVDTYAQRVQVESCTLLRSGNFMWDYGYLWQLLTWPEDYQPWEVERARRYFRSDFLRGGVTLADGDDRVQFDNRARPLAVSRDAEPNQALTFLGGALPTNLVRGRQYFIVESSAEYVKIAAEPHGQPLRFAGDSGQPLELVHNLSATYLGAYSPTGSGPGKGAVDITCARDVRIAGCQLSALGDTMHVQRCRNVVFTANHILGSRMGAFFLAEFCQNATIAGNLVDGTNGSRVMSVEKSCTDVTITGNTFRNGGRGSWINQPRNFVLTGNVFVNNTTKGEADPRRGRCSYQTGQPVRFPELYFTLHQVDGSYGPVIVRDNIFVLGDAAAAEAVTFAPHGHDLLMTGNVFQGRTTPIRVDPSCTGVDIRDNPGGELLRQPVDFNHGRR